MSWLFSQALVEEFLEENSLDGEPSAPSSGNPTQQAYCAPDKMTVFSRLSRFGMTYKPLTENLGAKLLMLYLAAFPARTYPLQEKEMESTENDQECDEKWLGSFVKFDPDTSSWKTHQCSLLGDLDEFSETWPQWGLMRDGECWEQQTLGHQYKGTGYGLLPAPVATDYKGSRTPEGLIKAGRSERNSLRDFLRAKLGWSMPTPAGSEVLMGWPLGWTDLKPLETDKSHFAPQPHGDC